ncbi:unnamed protein product, partial [Didymodactylos carnosus]
SLALTVLSLTLGLFFILVGQFKVTPKFFPEVHEDMRREFGRVNKVFPLYKQTGWRPFAKNYRLFIGFTEIVCGAILALVPGSPKQLANVILLFVMLGAVYTHYILKDKFERMAPGLVFSLLLLTRLIIHRQVQQREKRTNQKQPTVTKKESKNKNKNEKENDSQVEEEYEEEDRDEEQEEQTSEGEQEEEEEEEEEEKEEVKVTQKKPTKKVQPVTKDSKKKNK